MKESAFSRFSMNLVSQPERTSELHTELRDALWDNSRIQIHSGKMQIWNRGGGGGGRRGGMSHLPTPPFSNLLTWRIPRPDLVW